jgi:hypothetical protein
VDLRNASPKGMTDSRRQTVEHNGSPDAETMATTLQDNP